MLLLTLNHWGWGTIVTVKLQFISSATEALAVNNVTPESTTFFFDSCIAIVIVPSAFSSNITKE